MSEERGVPSLASRCGPIALFQAIRSGDHIEVKRLIDELGISVDSRGPLKDIDNVDISLDISSSVIEFSLRSSKCRLFIWLAGSERKRSLHFLSIGKQILNLEAR